MQELEEHAHHTIQWLYTEYSAPDSAQLPSNA